MSSIIQYQNQSESQQNIETVDEEELSDEELEAAERGDPWCPAPEQWNDEDYYEHEEEGRQTRIPPLYLSQFTEFAFQMPLPTSAGYANFSFDGRRHMLRPYNTKHNRILMFCGRQVEKSTFLGNTAIGISCMRPAHRTLYVAPSASQARTFSLDRIKEPIETSPILRSWTTRALMNNVMEKQFVNRSKITMRYAFLNADRTRGIPAEKLLLDEMQDILVDNIPVIEQCTSHADESVRSFLYAGTPKGLENPLEFYRANFSTQGEWMVPCDGCGYQKGAGRYWNILGESNIGKKSLICSKCGKQIHPMHDDAQWAVQVPLDGKQVIFESYRIPQLMVPWKPWSEILIDYRRYPRDKFYNEVLGLSFDSGLRPITQQQIKNVCNPKITMHPVSLEKLRKSLGGREVFMGIDWGTAENSYTVMTLGLYVGMKFRIFFIHRFTGEDVDPEILLDKIISIAHAYQVKVIGADYGGGFDRNHKLVNRFGIQRVQKFQYNSRPRKKIEWQQKLLRWSLHRSEVMSDMFTAIKKGKVEFPRWEEFHDPYAKDMLSIFSEYNHTLRMIQYNHRVDQPDDAFHSVLYCLMAACMVHPRPDIWAPNKEDPRTGAMVAAYTGPIPQG